MLVNLLVSAQADRGDRLQLRKTWFTYPVLHFAVRCGVVGLRTILHDVAVVLWRTLRWRWMSRWRLVQAAGCEQGGPFTPWRDIYPSLSTFIWKEVPFGLG